MKKLLALISARNKEFYRDRPAMIWTFLFPFIVLAGFKYGYSEKQDPLLRIWVFPTSTLESPLIHTLRQVPGLEIKASINESDAIKKLEHYETDLVILASSDPHRMTYAINQTSDKGRLSEHILLSVQHKVPSLSLESKKVAGQKLRYSDWLLPGLLAMNIMFGSLFGVGYVIVRYRKNGVLKRMRATPLTAFLFLCAHVTSRLLLMVVTSLIVLGGSMFLVGFKPQGSWLHLILFLSIGSASMISLGLIVAARISNEEVAEGILNLMTWPMIFLSGVWFSIDGASQWVQWGAKLMPLTHVVTGLRSILLEGSTLGHLTPEITGLMCMSVIFLAIGSAFFRWR